MIADHSGSQDTDDERVWQGREELRRQGLQALAERIAQTHGHPDAGAMDEAVDVLYAPVAFETFHAIAGTKRPYEQVAPVVYRLALTALGLEDDCCS